MAIRKAAEEAEAASAGSKVPCVPNLEKEVSVVDEQVTVDSVEKELAIVVGAFDSDADDKREKCDTRHGSSEDTKEQNVDRDKVEELHDTLGDSVSDEAMRELFDKQQGSSENMEEGNVFSADSHARDVAGTELSAIFGSGASRFDFDPIESSTPIREDPNKRSASMGDEGDDTQKEMLTGLDHLKRLKLDLSASDSDDGRNQDLHLQVSPVQVDPSYVLTIHDAGGGGGFGDNEDLNTGGGYEKIVSGVGDTGVNDVGDQDELGDNGGENGMGQEEVHLKIVDKGGGHEKGEHSDGDSSE